MTVRLRSDSFFIVHDCELLTHPLYSDVLNDVVHLTKTRSEKKINRIVHKCKNPRYTCSTSFYIGIK